MTNEELINALRCEKDCDDCAYHTDNLWSRCDEWGMRCDAADALEAAEKRIKELEARIPKEGEWIPYTGWCKCSVCGHGNEWYSPCCPNCGARMRGEQE